MASKRGNRMFGRRGEGVVVGHLGYGSNEQEMLRVQSWRCSRCFYHVGNF
jgi:hypothetical protein